MKEGWKFQRIYVKECKKRKVETDLIIVQQYANSCIFWKDKRINITKKR
jgi:hypothetical protein